MEIDVLNKYVLSQEAREFVSVTWPANMTSGDPDRNIIWDVSRQAEAVIKAKLAAHKGGGDWIPNGSFSDCACIFAGLIEAEKVKEIHAINYLTWNEVRQVLKINREMGGVASYKEGISAVRNGGCGMTSGAVLLELIPRNGFSTAEGRWALCGYNDDNRDVAMYMQKLWQ